MNKNQVLQIKNTILDSQIIELRGAEEPIVSVADRITSQLLILRMIKPGEFNVDQNSVGAIMGLILGNFELFKKLYGSEKTIDFIESRRQWLNENKDFSQKDLDNLLVQLEIEVLEFKLGQRSCVRMKTTFNILNAVVYLLSFNGHLIEENE